MPNGFPLAHLGLEVRIAVGTGDVLQEELDLSRNATSAQRTHPHNVQNCVLV